MDATEIVRRIRALLAMPESERPISVDRLESIAGISDGLVYKIAKSGVMQQKSIVRLSRALELVENDQIAVKMVHKKPSQVSIRSPKPPQINVQRVTFVNGRPKIEIIAINPRAFPVLDNFGK